MKYTMSKDGKYRMNLPITIRFTKEEIEDWKKIYKVKTINELKDKLYNELWSAYVKRCDDYEEYEEA